MNYIQVYPDGKNYNFPILTEYHKKGCIEGYWLIIDLKNSRDMINGQWTKKLKITE